MHRVLICGYYGRRNAGDEAILGGMLADLRRAVPEAAFTVVSGEPDSTRSLHAVNSIAWGDVEALIEAVREADLVIVGGGGLFHDYWGVDPATLLTSRQAGIAEYGGPIVLAELLGRPSMLYGVGVGPLTSNEGRRATADLVALAGAVNVRDAASRHLLGSIGCELASVSVAADPAFSLPGAPLPDALGAFVASLQRPILGIALRHWSIGVAQHEWEQAVAAAIDRHLESVGGTALFVPLQDGANELEDDVAVAERVRALLARWEQSVLAPSDAGPLDRFRLLERCDRMLGMRLHALVAGLRGRKPCVGLAYDPKVTALMAAAGLGRASLPIDAWTPDRIAQALAGHAVVEHDVLEGLQRRSRRSAALAAELIGREVAELSPAQAALRRVALDRVYTARYFSDLSDHLARELEEKESQLSAQAGIVKSLAAGVERLREELEWERATTGAALAGLRQEKHGAVRQRAEAERHLAALRGTLGVRLLGAYWKWARRAFPVGSRRRRIAARVRRAMFGPRSPGTHLGRSPGLPLEGRGATTSEELRAFLNARDPAATGLAVLVLAPTQLLEDEGQRSTHLTLELASRGIPVVFAYWRWGREERRPQDRIEQGIYQVPLDELVDSPAPVLSALSKVRRLLLIEFPHPDFFGLVAAARGAGWISVYDVVDDWEGFHRVGQAPWYRPDSEAHLLSTADAVTAVSPALVDKVRHWSGRQAECIPNGLRIEVARVHAPVLLDRGEVTLGYFGNLTRAWFDWDLTRQLAEARPAWRIHLIGFGDVPPSRPPANVVMHGKIPPSQLAAYAANWDVGIIPFKRSPLAAAADTTKLYEYLAMGLPVVVTGVLPPAGTEGLVASVEGWRGFIEKCERISRPGAYDAVRGRAFAAGCQWRVRVDRLLEVVEGGEQRIALQAALFEASR